VRSTCGSRDHRSNFQKVYTIQIIHVHGICPVSSHTFGIPNCTPTGLLQITVCPHMHCLWLFPHSLGSQRPLCPIRGNQNYQESTRRKSTSSEKNDSGYRDRFKICHPSQLYRPLTLSFIHALPASSHDFESSQACSENFAKAGPPPQNMGCLPST